MTFFVFVFILFAGCSFNQVVGQGQSTGQGTLTGPNDPVVPVITFLQQLQRLRELYAAVNPRAILNGRTSDPLSLTLNLDQSNGPFSNFGTPLQSSSLGNGLLDNVPGNIGNNNNLNLNNAPSATAAPPTRKLPFNIPFIGSLTGLTRRSPAAPRRLNRALAEITEGIRSANLERVLRGSLQLTRLDGLRSVGDSVLTNAFNTVRRTTAPTAN